ncbi:uncharacterized protein LOC114527596 [Dendronephthya gigantea]|uniref:uncharacterized protein LOC114527596 n=1 Tax=Dendronephthya gigantea TaxID=151771 RepID=UPI00106BC6FD|nr:uncharacterized protein LOC114527596 [Dendronephthya gigantea]
MSLPKQFKSVRCWMSKRSAKSMTDIGYSITLDSNLRAYRDYDTRSINRNRLEVIRGSCESISKDGMSDTEDSDVMEKQFNFTKGIQELRNFKDNNSILEHRINDGLRTQCEVLWIHRVTDKQSIDIQCTENRLSHEKYAAIQVYEGYFYGCKHWNFYCVDDDVGAVILSLKVEFLHGKEYIRILVRSSIRSVHVVILPSLLGVYEHFTDPFSWIEIFTQLLKLTRPLQVVNHHTAGLKLVKLDRVFVKSDFKIGVLYIKHGQQTEDEIFSNISHSTAFESFLHLLGERVDLQDFEGYSGGLDTSNSLNGTQSIYTEYRSNRIMFHVSSLMPNTGEDNKYLGKKRHVGNDVLCVVFTDRIETSFSPHWIKSQFLHAYILVQVLPASTDNHSKFQVSVICRQEVPWFGPRLSHDGTFDEGDVFREWLLEKIINGDRACYEAPKFASVQQRTRSQIMNGILDNEVIDVEGRVDYSTPLTPSASSSLESLERLFPDDPAYHLDDNSPKLKYFYCSQGEGINSGDVAFLAGKTYKKRIYGTRSVMCRKSRVFRDMLTDWAVPGNYISTDHTQLKEDSLVKLAFKKARAQAMMQNNSKKGKFAIETSLPSLSNINQYVTTTSIKKAGQTYGISLDCIGRTREFVMNEFESEIFAGVIEYIHNDKCSITYETLPGLLCAATYYELPDLRLSCLNRRDDVIEVSTVCRMLNIVEEYILFKDGRELQERLLQYFVNHILEILGCEEHLMLTKSRIILVLSQNWKCEDDKNLKVKLLVLWAKCKDNDDWKHLAESVICSCSLMNGVVLDENTCSKVHLTDGETDNE